MASIFGNGDISPVSDKTKDSSSEDAITPAPLEPVETAVSDKPSDNAIHSALRNINDTNQAKPTKTTSKFTEKDLLSPTISAPNVLEDIDVSTLPFADDDTGRRVLTEEKGYEYLGFAFTDKKKWTILSSIFLVQISMNFNAAIYGAAVPGLKKHFGISSQKAHLGQFIFLVAYAFGCELWAPWSEELGRKWVLNGSLALVNLWQIPCVLAPNFWTLFGFRFLGGLSSAGGSVTLGMVADMWEPADQQYAVAFVVFSSVAGSVVAPIVGGFITQYLAWQWVFWISLIFGLVAQALHLFVPETRSSILLARQAAKLRKQGHNVYARDELAGSFWERLDWKESCKLMWRPYQFLLTEPIVTFLSLLSGFSDALIFTGLDSFGLVLAKWQFSYVAIGLAFIPLLIGYLIAYAMYMWEYHRQRKTMYDPIAQRRDTRLMSPERRLKLLLWLVPLESLGLLGFAFASLGPPAVKHWIAPLIFTALIGIANFAIYMATIDYMIAAYGPFSASATGGNGFCRDFLAGIAALYATPFYTKIKQGTRWQLTIPSCILAGIAVIGAIPVYIFYIKGAEIRMKSPYAQTLATEREERKEERGDAMSRAATPLQSRRNTPGNSRAASPVRGGGAQVYQRGLGVRAREFDQSRPGSRAGSLKGLAGISELEKGESSRGSGSGASQGAEAVRGDSV